MGSFGIRCRLSAMFRKDVVKAWKKLQPLFEGGYKFYPDFGSPFIEPEVVKQKKKEMPESIFRKQARKRK